MSTESLLQPAFRQAAPALAALIAAAALSGCVVAPVGLAYGAGGYYDEGVVTAEVAPPAPYVETFRLLHSRAQSGSAASGTGRAGAMSGGPATMSARARASATASRAGPMAPTAAGCCTAAAGSMAAAESL